MADCTAGCCKKTFLPMTSVIEGVVLAYTLCCWESKLEITVSSKLRY